MADRRRVPMALAILTAINFVNYIDRYLPAAVFEPIKHELHFSDEQLGWVLSAFMIGYALTSPLFGRLGDLFTRKYLISAGITVWSFATAGAGLARSFWQMFAPRSIVGIGEASYATIAPGIITDLYDRAHRGRALAIFYAAIPVGTALGFILGGQLTEWFGWRSAFFMVGLPGLALAALVLMIREPERGATEVDPGSEGGPPASLMKVYGMLWRNRAYVFVTLGFIAYTFALGGLVGWVPTFLERYDAMNNAEATRIFGVLTVAAGFVGTFSGGFLGDYLLGRTKNAYLWVSAVGMLIGAPITVLALLSRRPEVYMPAIFGAEFFLFLSTGPLNAMVLNTVKANIRATAMAVNIFFIHALGDVISPPIIGAISDRYGLLRASMIAPAMMIVSGIILLYGMRYYHPPGEQQTAP